MPLRVMCRCGTEFETTEKRRSQGRGRYCSRGCRATFSNIGVKRSHYTKKVINSGWFAVGVRNNPSGEFVKGVHSNPEREIRPGEHRSAATEFKPGQVPWAKGTKGLMPSGEAHHLWAGERAQYSTIHVWVARHLVKPPACSQCGRGGTIQWSNISGEYRRDLADWRALCWHCHHEYDRENIPGASVRKKRTCAA